MAGVLEKLAKAAMTPKRAIGGLKASSMDVDVANILPEKESSRRALARAGDGEIAVKEIKDKLREKSKPSNQKVADGKVKHM